MSSSLAPPHLLDALAPGSHLARLRIVVGAAALAKGVSFGALDGAPAYLLWVWIPLSVAVVLGIRARIAAVALAALSLLPLFSGFYRNHLYLLGLMLLLVGVSQCSRELSIYTPRVQHTLVPGWPLRLMQWQLSIVYVFAGLVKTTPEFLSGEVLEAYLATSMLPRPIAGVLGAHASLLAKLVTPIELFLGLAAWSPRARPLAVAFAAPLHLGMLTVSRTPADLVGVAIFAVLMFSLWSSFFWVPISTNRGQWPARLHLRGPLERSDGVERPRTGR